MSKSSSLRDLAQFLENNLEDNKHSLSLVKENNLPTPSSHFDDILGQRLAQRGVLFWTTLVSTEILLILVVILVWKSISSLGTYGLEILAVSVFAQFIAVVMVIAKALWNDDAYKEILKDDRQNK